jgi:hypothetical protein
VIGKHEIFCGEFTMFFYTSLFIVSIFVALIVLWLYHSIADVGQTLLKSILPDKKKGPTSHLSARIMSKTINETQTPWGWRNHETPAKRARAHAATPLNYHGAKNVAADSSRSNNAAWVHREERSELAGKSYKVTRKNETVAEGLKASDRPWNW